MTRKERNDIQMYEYSDANLSFTPGKPSSEDGAGFRVVDEEGLLRALEKRNPKRQKPGGGCFRSASKSMKNFGKSACQVFTKCSRGRKQENPVDRRTSGSSHFEVPDGLNKEILKDSEENTRLQQEDLAKTKTDLQVQNLESESDSPLAKSSVKQINIAGGGSRFDKHFGDYSDQSRILQASNKPRRFATENLAGTRDSHDGLPSPELRRSHSEQWHPSTRRRAGLKVQPNVGIVNITRDSGGMDILNTGDAHDLIGQKDDFDEFVKKERIFEWAKSFRQSDPRFQILNFFEDICQQGADNIEDGFNPDMASPLLRMFNKASVFTVWRPTSLDAIRRMMLGEGVGKGLDIKGKSAKRGTLSGYVPFLQIYQEEHKRLVKTHPKDGRIKVFFKTEQARDHVVKQLNVVGKEMVDTFKLAKQIVKDATLDENTMEWALERMIWEMTDTTIHLLNEYAPKSYGMHVPERLFWEGMVMRQDISREPGSKNDTGRPSHPSFQNMNCVSLRKEPKDGGPKTVILQYLSPGEENSDPMNPLNLVMAYEENGRVMPVVSDFDCFTVGTRGVRYEKPMPADQVEILKWSVNQIEKVLDNGMNGASWTSRWLDILKNEASNGFHPEMPALGYSDPKSINIMKNAIYRLRKEGAVRHGSECFNYYFPQELDDQFLVISNDIPGSLRWQYVDQKGLQEVLSMQIDKGYTFPLNPKWVLCDKGWKVIYDKLMASQSPNVQDSLGMWYPQEIRDQIEAIHNRHPDGFIQPGTTSAEKAENDGTAAMDLAEQELRAYLTFQRAKRKLRGIFVWRSLLTEMRKGQERKVRNGSKVHATAETGTGLEGEATRSVADIETDNTT